MKRFPFWRESRETQIKSFPRRLESGICLKALSTRLRGYDERKLSQTFPKYILLTLLLSFAVQQSFAFDQEDWFGKKPEAKNKTDSKAVEIQSEQNIIYQINAGDLLEINVWREPDLNKDVIVRPDGAISVPLVGEVIALGKTINELQEYIAKELEKYIPEPVVTVSTKSIMGNKVFIVGNVNRPGEIVMNQRINVMQAIGIAGGTSTFASPDQIKILRRVDDKQIVIPFHYGEVEKGKNLEQNILLLSGDVLVVP